MSVRKMSSKYLIVAVLLVAVCLGALVIYGWQSGQIPQLGDNAQQGKVYADHVVINEVCYPQSGKISWFELYNPTNETIDMENWRTWFYSVDGSIRMPSVRISPGECIVVCENEHKFVEDWAPIENLKIVELDGWGIDYDSIGVSDPSFQLVDIVGVDNHHGTLPSLPQNHSWSRYAGGYDTDNFANDFYDEPSPTPGMVNPGKYVNLSYLVEHITEFENKRIRTSGVVVYHPIPTPTETIGDFMLANEVTSVSILLVDNELQVPPENSTVVVEGIVSCAYGFYIEGFYYVQVDSWWYSFPIF